MAVTQAEVLDLFAQAAAIKDSDQILILTSNKDKTISPTKITAEVLRAYLSLGDVLTVDSEGYICINGERTQTITATTPELVQTTTMLDIKPNVLNVWQTAISSLAIGFIAGDNNAVNEYMLQFTVRGNNFTLTLPNGVLWVEEEPEWEDGYTYQVSIVNNLAVSAGWDNSNNL